MVESFGHAVRARDDGAARPAHGLPDVVDHHRASGPCGRCASWACEPGRDVSIITHDDDLSFLRNSGAVPLFTATRSSIRAAGRRSAEMLIARIADPDAAPRSELWEVELTLGRSTGPCPRKARHG